MTVTIQDIAREAGVSIATVSRVINGTKEVSPELKKKVNDIIERNNFKPNPIARGLVTKKTHTIGIIIPDIANAIFGALTKGINSICQLKGYSLMVFESGGSKEKELELLDLLEEKTVDGALFAGVDVDDSLGMTMQSKRYPIVLVTQEASAEELHLHTVIHDNYAAFYEATNYLINNGHRRIGFIGGPEHDYSSVIQRFMGYQSALESQYVPFVPDYVEYGDFTLQSGYEGMRRLYEKAGSLPTAVIAGSDIVALGVLKFLRHVGLSVPKDISVMGFDDLDLAVYSSPELSTVRISYYDEGVIAAKTLFALMKKKKDVPERITVPHQIIHRQSVMFIQP